MLSGVKRLQILIDEDLDDALERRAATEGISKAELADSPPGPGASPLPAAAFG
jgi:hypothetical protein